MCQDCMSNVCANVQTFTCASHPFDKPLCIHGCVIVRKLCVYDHGGLWQSGCAVI